MPIRPEFRALYPKDWANLSQLVRFERAGRRCQHCRRPHLVHVRCLPDGRWFDETAATWLDRRGRLARWPDLMEAGYIRSTRVVLAAAHLDNNPTNNRLANLRGLCQRCHMLHDRPFHLAQRWLTYRRRWAIGDLFFGRYGLHPPSRMLFAETSRDASLGVAHNSLRNRRTDGAMSGEWHPPQARRPTTMVEPAEDLFKTMADQMPAIRNLARMPSSATEHMTGV